MEVRSYTRVNFQHDSFRRELHKLRLMMNNHGVPLWSGFYASPASPDVIKSGATAQSLPIDLA